MVDSLYIIGKTFIILIIVAIVLNFMAFVSQELERIRINTDKIVEKL